MRALYICCSLALGFSGLAEAQLIQPEQKQGQQKPVSIYDSVVRIEATTQVADYRTPWKTGFFGGGTGTGFLIGENLFMTNAHVVSDQQRVLITRHGSAQKHKVKILHVAHDCDLALFSLEDFTPFEGLKKLEFDGVPVLESSVRVIGYPIGGDRISVTRGVVSRIDFIPYSHSRVDSHLVVQIDAAINPGNSGGPVLQDGKVVGVAFQGINQADNTGYMIPTPVIKRFLKDVEDGSYDEYVDIGVRTFPLFNPAMRQVFKMKNGDPGILVTSVTSGGSADGALEKGDILYQIDDYEIDSSGSISIHGERVDLNEVVERKFVGDELRFKVIREGAKKELKTTLKSFKHSKIFAKKYEKKPLYTIRGGLVFQPLDRSLYTAHRLSSPRVRRLYNTYISDEIYKTRKDIVVLTSVLKHSVNSSLGGFAGNAVKTINGVEVESIEHVHELLNPKEIPEFFVIECDGIPRPVVIAAREASAADQDIKSRYGVTKLFNLEE